MTSQRTWAESESNDVQSLLCRSGEEHEHAGLLQEGVNHLPGLAAGLCHNV
jgi:hypothetical protein